MNILMKHVLLVLIINSYNTFAAQAADREHKQDYSWILVRAARAGNAAATKIALTKGAPCNQVDPLTGETPLMIAASCGNTEITELLLKNKATVNAANTLKETALIKAAQKGFEPIVTMLLAYRADIHLHDAKGKSAGLYAIDNGHIDTALAITHAEMSEIEKEGLKQERAAKKLREAGIASLP